MKKILFGIVASILCIAAIILAYRAGHKEGFRHAIEDSVHFIVDYEEHDDYDYDLYIDIDGNTYLTKLFVG